MSFNPVVFASRPTRAAQAKKAAFVLVAAVIAVSAAKVAMAHRAATMLVQTVERAPGGEAIAKQQESRAQTQAVCRQVEALLDEGYGVSGKETRWLCRAAP
ncbi:MAG: hypothetical protein HYS06_13625 [Methylocystis sp.]|nr:hypothetical protein [Methylocystis sp.]